MPLFEPELNFADYLELLVDHASKLRRRSLPPTIADTLSKLNIHIHDIGCPLTLLKHSHVHELSFRSLQELRTDMNIRRIRRDIRGVALENDGNDMVTGFFFVL